MRWPSEKQGAGNQRTKIHGLWVCPHPPTTRVTHTYPNHSKGRSHSYICVDIHYPLPKHICRLLVSRLLFLDDRFVRCRARPMQNLRPPEAPSPAKHQFPPIPGPKPQGSPRSPQSPGGRLSPLTLSASKWTLDQAGACLRLDGSPCPLLCPFIVLSPHPPSPRLLSASLTFQPSPPSPPPPTVRLVLATPAGRGTGGAQGSVVGDRQAA